MTKSHTSTRPAVLGTVHMVSSGHYLATQAGLRVLEAGGNAIDAGVAAGIALNVVQPHWTSFGGVAPIMVYRADSGEVLTISGLGTWPRAASIEYFQQHHGGDMPPGIPRTVVPSAADAWLTALERFGTMTLREVTQPALELAERGFPVHHQLHEALVRNQHLLEQWSSTRQALTINGRIPQVGEVLVQGDLAHSFRRLVEAEQASQHQGREAAIRAARDEFYRGDLARRMVEFCQAQGGLLTMEDTASFSVEVEVAQRGTYKDYTVYTCGAWCQGPVLIQALNLLEDEDLVTMGHNSPEYIHLVTEALKLAFADRHHYYGDPRYVEVPLASLLSKEYAARRKEALDRSRAWPRMPDPGNPWGYQATRARSAVSPSAPGADAALGDTSYVCVVDRWGNAFSATPSDFMAGSPIVPGLGFLVSHRGEQSWLDPEHPSRVEPGKRPRLTPNPAMVFKGGKLLLPFGTPGGDVQVQAMLQMLLNIVEFGMDPQQALEEPRFGTFSFPNSFWPHAEVPGSLYLEGRISKDIAGDLERRGHDLRRWSDWDPAAGGLCGILVDQERGVLWGAADPRRESYAVGR